MNKRRFIKGNLRRSDYLRAVLTDTAPYEMPVIVSNDGFYRNLVAAGTAPDPIREVVEKLITKTTAKYTIPFRYKVMKDQDSVRGLSLPHPAAQYRISEFYQNYEPLIPYYCGWTSISLRRPEKSGSTFFFRSDRSDENRYRNNKVDLQELDKFVRNPASFYAYKGVQRLHKFFDSSDFLRLEKKFSRMTMMDISKCFSSIYTHTISWAVKTADHAKHHTQINSFGNDFDRLMMWMNYGETNGICIGPETSRIFAEVILSRIDLNITQQCAEIGILSGVHFELRRYVDDYILFCGTDEIEAEVRKIIEERLSEYNLHLNSQKLEKFQRPFITQKSHTINLTKKKLYDFFEGIIERNGPALVPKKIHRPDALVRSLINTIKSICHEQRAGYDIVANYVISSLVKRIERLIDGHDFAIENGVDISLYPPALLRLLEAAFFLYAVNPTVASSFNVSRAVILVWRYFQSKHRHETLSAAGQIQRWVSQLVRQHQPGEKFEHRAKVHVEFLNIILATCEIDGAGDLDEALLRQAAFGGRESDYFSLVSCLYYIKNRVRYSNLRADVQAAIEKRLGDCKTIYARSHEAHLLLDVLSCPFLPANYRARLLSRARAALGLSARTNAERESDIAYFQANPWFVQWDRLDILSMIQKKELSSVY